MTYSFKKVIIAADLSETDDNLIFYTQLLTQQTGLEKLYLAHIIPNMLVPENSKMAFEQMFQSDIPIQEKVRDTLSNKFKQYFSDSTIEPGFEVLEGNAYKKLLELIEQKGADLLVVGKKKHSEGSGITAKRITRKAPCHILFIPEEIPEKIQNIVVPVDFSENSARALKAAYALKPETAKITALNVVRILYTDYYIGLDQNKVFRNSMQEQAMQAFVDFEQKYALEDMGLQKEVIINEYNNVSSQLNDYLQEHKAELVVMGAQGHTALQSFLLGSVTESFIDRTPDVPVLVIR